MSRISATFFKVTAIFQSGGQAKQISSSQNDLSTGRTLGELSSAYHIGRKIHTIIRKLASSPNTLCESFKIYLKLYSYLLLSYFELDNIKQIIVLKLFFFFIFHWIYHIRNCFLLHLYKISSCLTSMSYASSKNKWNVSFNLLHEPEIFTQKAQYSP